MRDLLEAALVSGRRHARLVATVVIVGVGTAVGSSLAINPAYQSAASFTLTKTHLGLRMPATVAGRVVRIESRVQPRADSVEVLARVGDPVVRVYAIADDPERARRVANSYAIELAALEHGVDRRRIAHRISALRQRLATLLPRQRAERQRMLAELRSLEGRQVGAADIVAARTAGAVRRPRPFAHALAALAISSMFGLAFAQLLDRMPSRERARPRARPRPRGAARG